MGEPKIDLAGMFKDTTVGAAPPLEPYRGEMGVEGILTFAREAPMEYLICRQGRHRYPYVAPKDKVYRRDKFGYDIFVVDCELCGEAYREERWTIKEDGKGLVTQMRFWKATTKYHEAEGGGRSDYLLPKGSGYIPGRKLLEAHTTLQMVGGMVRRAS